MRHAILLAALAALISSCSIYDAAVGPPGDYTLEATVTPVAPDAAGGDYRLTQTRVVPLAPDPSGATGDTTYQLTDIVITEAP